MATPPFIIGVFSQPIRDWDKWRRRGVNTLVSHEPESGKITKLQWEQEAIRQGWSFMDYPGADLAAEAVQPGRVAWMQLDEPDLSSHVDGPGYTREQLKSVFARCKQTSVAIPVFMNLAGPAFDNQWYDGMPKPDKADASKYGHRAVDPSGKPVDGYMAWSEWICHDYHLWSKAKPRAYFITDRLQSRADEWSGHKEQFVFIETNDCGSGVSFSPDDLEQQVWRKIMTAARNGHRLRGIIYWSHVTIPRWRSFDGTSEAVAERMTEINAKLMNLFEPTAAPFPARSIAVQSPSIIQVTARVGDVNYGGVVNRQ